MHDCHAATYITGTQWTKDYKILCTVMRLNEMRCYQCTLHLKDSQTKSSFSFLHVLIWLNTICNKIYECTSKLDEQTQLKTAAAVLVQVYNSYQRALGNWHVSRCSLSCESMTFGICCGWELQDGGFICRLNHRSSTKYFYFARPAGNHCAIFSGLYAKLNSGHWKIDIWHVKITCPIIS